MTDNPVQPDKDAGGLPIWIGLVGTLASLLIGLLVWIDNQQGFRDAGNFATLLSAVFSMISTIWLIVTVLRQGEELKLQREELRLQREETKRIADETKTQSDTIRSQMRLSHQNSLKERTQILIQSNEFDLSAFQNSIFRFISDIFCAQFPDTIPISPHSLILEAKADFVECRLKNDFIESYDVDQSRAYLELRYEDLAIDFESDIFEVIGKYYAESEQYGCGNWFLNELGYAISGLDILSEAQVCFVLSVAAHKALNR